MRLSLVSQITIGIAAGVLFTAAACRRAEARQEG